MKNRNIILFCPSPYSNYSISVAYLLIKSGYSISAIVQRRVFNYNRFVFEFKHAKGKFIKKIFRKLILKSSENPSQVGDKTIISFMREYKISYKNIAHIASEYNIPIIKVNQFSDNKIITTLKKYMPFCSVFTGGGIIPKSVLALSGKGVINCHMGILPDYRGMDVVQWPILEENYNKVGITTHLMEPSIDTGPIIEKIYINPENFRDISMLRNHIESLMPQQMLNAVIKLSNNNFIPIKQELKKGRLYFRISKHLEKLLSTKFLKNKAIIKEKGRPYDKT